MKKYDVFISYRRDGGAETAKHLRDSLTEKGYRVFLDVESLRSGQFNTELYRVIEKSKDFILILPEHGLDRCCDPNDWIRLEVEHARRCGKNIIPIMLRGFEFPAFLPESMEFLRMQNGMQPNFQYYDAFVKKLRTFLTSRHRMPKSLRWIPIVGTLVLVGVLTFFGFQYFSRYPRNAAQRSLVKRLTTYMVQNLYNVDVAGREYDEKLDEVSNFLQGKSLKTLDRILLDLRALKSVENDCSADFTEMDEATWKELADSPFEDGNLKAFIPYLKSCISSQESDVDFLLEYLPTIVVEDSDELTEAQKVNLLRHIEILKELSSLLASELYLNINEVFVPVNVESALDDLLNVHLPSMKYIYGGAAEFCHDKTILENKRDHILEKSKSLLAEMDQNMELMDQRAERYFWDMGVKYLTVGSPNDAADEFQFARNHADEKTAAGTDSAYTFAAHYRQFEDEGVKSGVVIFEISGSAGDLKAGDIIYAVNDTTVDNKTAFEKALHAGENKVGILRFLDDNTYTLVEATYDLSRTQLVYRSLTEEPTE